VFYALLESLTDLRDFIEAGGDVLWLIAILTTLMWALILERIFYYRVGGLSGEIRTIRDEWRRCKGYSAWGTKQMREMLFSRGDAAIREHLPMIAALIALCPLMGLLGTVTGMIEVFNVMAVTGGGDAKSMAGGVSKATIPTLAGMVAALSGIFGSIYINRMANQHCERLKDYLLTEQA